MKKEIGITLIALVITIIVLLILAAVTISALTGDNGILKNAASAKQETEKTEILEQIRLDIYDAMIENGGIAPDENQIETIADNYGDIEGTIFEDKVLLTDKGNYEIKLSEIWTLTSGSGTEDPEDPPSTTGKTDGSYDKEEGVNTPKLKDNMKLVVYNNGEWVEDTTKSAYKYEAQTGSTENGGTSEWANAELDGNYYVWIPRYAYRIDKSTEYTSQSGTSYKIDVKFLIGTTNKYYDEDGNEKEAKIATNADETSAEGNTDYYVHPAFTFGDTPLEGLWIGKYESSDAGDNKIAILPNATSLRSINVSTMFSRAQNLSTTNIDAHMLKNTEWGAVAYLTQSQYGRNGTEVSVNQCENYITGAGKTKGTNLIYENTTYSTTPETIKGTEQAYNGEIGKLSSTTGNVYGIYDMSGGAWEYVMGIYGTTTPTTGSSGFTEFTDSKYYNLYTTTSSNNTNIGDALYETSGWNNDGTLFVYLDYPFFGRGSYYGYTSGAGVFLFGRGSGVGSSGDGFRVCLAVK